MNRELVRALMAQHRANRPEEQHDVTQHGPILHISDIQCLGFLLTQVGPAGYLPGAGDTGLHQHAGGIQLVVLGHFLRQRRTRTDHAHVTPEYIQELRKLVNRVFTNELAHLGDSGVILHLEDEPIRLPGLLRQLCLHLVGVHHHGTEFDHLERLTTAAHAGLHVKNRPAISHLDGNGPRDGNNRGANQCHQRHHNIEHTLLEHGPRRILRQADGHHRGTLNHTDVGLMAAHIHRRGNQRHFQVHGLHVQHKRVEIVREPVHHISNHHRLHAHGRGAFGKILAIWQRGDIPTTNLTDPLLNSAVTSTAFT